MDTVLVGVAPSPLRDVSNTTKNQRERETINVGCMMGGLGLGILGPGIVSSTFSREIF